jgi:allantoin racemase
VETPNARSEVIPYVIEIAKKMSANFEVIAVNCFLDPGVDPLKKTLRIPVIGPCESSLAIASLLGSKIGVVTVHGRALPMIRSRVRMLDHARKVRSVVGIPMNVLELYENTEQTLGSVIRKCEELKADSKVDVICLGCTGLAGIAARVQAEVGVSVIDPVGATVEMSRASLKFGIRDSHVVSVQSESGVLA